MTKYLYAALLLLLAIGCSRYPEVSGSAYEMAETLSTVCNLKSDQQLKQYRTLIDDRLAASEITSSEHAMLTQIADIAESGDWQGAELEARQLMLDQAGR
ncbi:hypothetical protein LOC68_12865 [Blastopirellula sp. JC732]|uniref:Lipoprotein n=1 Tax=Blastopirellula sediminis TaxID=2894196 RepID=A0A9X1MLC3_9BACT|nr:hypothetical protein [Blastopirellula sediminis]MCC9607419.1 hypothetical protein [Blastopirellula sediminis]MCC9629288.1 hypothetical protein [Blastopirellula sediminis]